MASAGISGTFAANGAELAAKTPSTSTGYKVLPWAGDDFTRGHRLRDGELPTFPDKADQKTDFVIVGGGMAGLSAAFFLRDHDFLLLEQYAQTGGTSSGGSYRGLDYSRGAVCTGSNAGLKKQVFEDLGIKPAIISAEDTAWHYGGQWLRTIQGDDTFHAELKRLMSEIKAADALPNSEAGLSQATFATYLSGYDSRFRGLINNICRSFFCAGSDYVSARAGFFAIRILTTDSYVFDGGNSGIARSLRSAINRNSPGRIHTDCFVWSVKPSDKGASVYYSDASGAVHRIDCKHAVVAVPPMIAMRIVPSLPDAIQAAWRQIEYGAFMVTNFCMPKKLLQYPFQSFADEPYPFGQMVMAEAPYQATGRYKPEMGSVLTVYHPFEHSPVGRAQVMKLGREEFAASMIAQLCRLFEPLENNLELVEITRWGHAGTVPKPGISAVLNKSNQYTTEWMTFAHSSAGGGQSLDGALSAARNAADRCLQLAGVV
jgi:protoporphyrinogen oxidase